MKPDSFGGFCGRFDQLPDRFKQGDDFLAMSFDPIRREEYNVPPIAVTW